MRDEPRSPGIVDRRLLSLARGAPAAWAATATLAVCGAGLAVGQAWALSRILDRAFLHGDGLADVRALLAALCAFGLLRAAAAGGMDLACAGAAIRVKTALRNSLLDHLVALGPAYTQARRTGELAATIVEGVEAVDAYLRQYLPQVLLAAVVPLFLLAVIGPVDPLSALILAVTAPLLPLFMILIGRAAESLTRRQFGLLSVLSAHFLDVLQGLTTLKLLRRSRDQVEVIRRVGDNYRAATLQVLRVAFLTGFALETVATLSTAIVAVQVGLRLLSDRMGFQDAMFVLVLAPELYLPLRGLGSRFHAGAAGVAAAERIFQVLAAPQPPAPAASPAAATPSLARPPSLRILNLHYAYDGSRAALRGMSLDIPSGGTTAIVGPSGGGKSTLVSVLLRFLEPSSGEITVDNHRLSEIPIEDWRGRVAWVPQSPHVFPMTLAENLRLACPSATEADLRRALAHAELAELVERLPMGIDTPLGERGARLSVGEVQRLAIARALLRRAAFVILDEPTAGLDPVLEARLLAATEALTRERTVLVVAHRLSTVHEADQIVVIQAGRAVERGTHAALWEAGGIYRRMLAAYQEGV